MPTKQKKESLVGIGVVEVRPFRLDGVKKVYDTDAFTKHNLIVEAGRATLLDLLLGVTRKKLTYIRWGKGGAASFPDGDPLVPLDVQDEDVDVYKFLIDKRLNPYKRISPTVCSYTETLICDEINDDVNEAAMLFEDQETLRKSIFARITFPTARLTIEKGSGLEIEWTFSFDKAREEV